MAGRTVFVNPSAFGRRRKRRKHRTSRRRRRNVQLAPVSNPRRRRRRSRRRNAGIAPFVSNPLIMSNPPRRRRRRSNPLAGLNFNNLLQKTMTYGGGAAIAVAGNALVLNRVDNVWARNGARIGAAVVGGSMLKGEMGAAFAGAMYYPVIQELAAHILGKSTVTGTEADMDVLAADLEDIMDELDSSDLQDDDEMGDDDETGDDGDILFG